MYRRTGLTVDPMFSASKARWLLESIPDGFRRAAAGDLCLGTLDSWLLWNLTGGAVHACDVTNASRTQLFNLETLTWDDTLLDIFGIPRRCRRCGCPARSTARPLPCPACLPACRLAV
ncbi:MAG: FGGY family carbohydrate kinase [Caldilineales bacterium]